MEDVKKDLFGYEKNDRFYPGYLYEYKKENKGATGDIYIHVISPKVNNTTKEFLKTLTLPKNVYVIHYSLEDHIRKIYQQVNNSKWYYTKRLI